MLKHLDDPVPLQAATTDEFLLVLSRVGSLRRRRTAAAVGASLATVAVVVGAAWASWGTLGASPQPVVPVAPNPHVSASESPCNETSPAGPPLWCPMALAAGTHTSSELAGDGPVAYSLTVPGGWGLPDPAAGPRDDPYALSLVSLDETTGLTVAVDPTTARCDASSCTYSPTAMGAEALAASLLSSAGTSSVGSGVVGGLPGWRVESRGMPREVATGTCAPAGPCIPLLGRHIEEGQGGSTPPVIGRLPGPDRFYVVDVPTTDGTLTVVVWLWTAGDGGSVQGLDRAQQVFETLRFTAG